jgi:hypothetical protein
MMVEEVRFAGINKTKKKSVPSGAKDSEEVACVGGVDEKWDGI